MAKSLCSIIIPVHNKAALTRKCLESLFAAPPRVPFEVIVVDDASSDATPALLDSYGERLRSVRLDRNAGFATACNTGAAAAKGEYLVFLNNDTLCDEGWLDALHAYAEEHPSAAVVGSRLLFPDRTIQHAGVAFSLSGDPLHIYAGFPAEHPAVTKSRRFQAVTAACLLIRGALFGELEGFDTDYHNDLEDVDLCLRLGELGHEVHYCHTSVLYHLESASRAARFHEGRSAKLYRERWGARVRSDELDYYLEDSLLDLLRYSPERVRMDGGRRQREAELLQIRSRQILALLRETVRVSSYAADGAANSAGRTRPSPRRTGRRGRAAGAPARGRSRRRADSQVASLRTALADALEGHQPPPAREPEAPPARPEGYAGEVTALAEVVESVTPEGATVLVVSKGDEKLVDLPGRRGWHFPRAEDGRYRGYYPASDEDALAHLEELRGQGAQYLAFPSVAFWWLEHYPGFARTLRERYGLVARTGQCLLFALGPQPPARTTGEPVSDADYARVVAQLKRVVGAVVPGGETVLVVSKGDEKLVDLPGRRGWHFPRAEDGRYRGYYPASDDDAVAHLEELRARGAAFIALPATAFWWLEQYPGFAQALEEGSAVAARTESCAVFDLRAAGAIPSAAAAPASSSPLAVSTELAPSDYERLVERARALVAATVPEGATVLVVSKGDEKLVDLPGRHGWHFPRAEDGRYRGYYPASDDDAIAHLEELRSQGAAYIVFPNVAFWWLDHYPGLAGHLRGRYATAAYEHDTALVFELAEPLVPELVRRLLPGSSRVALLSPFRGDLVGLDEYEAVQLVATTAEETIERLEELATAGARFLVIPRSSFTWLEGRFELVEHLRTHHRLVTRQRHVCEIWALAPGLETRDGGSPDAAVEAPDTVATGSGGPVEQAPESRGLFEIFRLWWKRRGNRSENA